MTNTRTDAPKRPPIAVPFTIIVDGREKMPYTFTGISAGSRYPGREFAVTTQWGHLHTGDYSILGMEKIVCIERKSKEDLYTTLGQNRERFEREHQRMAEFELKAVFVESSWWDLTTNPPFRSRLNPRTINPTFISWFVQYGVPWFMCCDRRGAEIQCFRLLKRFYERKTLCGSTRNQSAANPTSTLPPVSPLPSQSPPNPSPSPF